MWYDQSFFVKMVRQYQLLYSRLTQTELLRLKVLKLMGIVRFK